ncbi:MAG: SLC13 family permease [Acidobacteria bacterium]|nr:SLC13 family permease [Acidobacteriota bacterium]
MQIAIVLGLLAFAIVLFAIEKLSVDLITLILLMALVLTRILTPAEAFAGFSQDIIIILASIFIISGALQKSGLMDALGMWLYKFAGGSDNRLLLTIMAVVAAVSAFMNNTTVTAIFVPPVLGVARQSKISASKLLMPVAFASILGGTCTLIGTSTNVAVSGYIAKVGMQPLTMFEVTPIGLIVTAVGIAYMMLLGKRMLPDHQDASLTEGYAMREYLSEIIVMADSNLVGQRIFESDLSKKEFRILEVIRGAKKSLPTPRTVIEANDVLLIEGKVEELIKVKETAGIEIRAEMKLGDLDLQSDDIKIAEVLVTSKSDLIGRTVKDANFRSRYGLSALAIYRHGQSLREKLGRIRLRLGDLLLVQGTSDKLEDLRRTGDLWVLEEFQPRPYAKQKGLYTLAFFAVAVLAGSLGLVPLSIAFLGAAVLAALFRCLTIEEAYASIDWRLLILIGGMTAFGTAMDKTGAAEFLAAKIVNTLNPMVANMPEPWGVTVILGAFFVLTVMLTQPMSNAAAALVVLPVALETAQKLGVNQRTFAIAIMVAASVSFVTPFEPSCILVYGPGKYRFLDFVKTGTILTIILILITLLAVPMIWPLHPMPGHSVP